MINVRNWMYLPRRLSEFEIGVTGFLNASFSKAAMGGQIVCPCKRFKNRYWYRRDEVFDHLKGQEFVDNYYVWVFHEEKVSEITSSINIDDNEAHMHDNIDELLHDRFRDNLDETSTVKEGVINEEAKKFYMLVEEGKQELYPGCKNFSKLSFIVRLFLYKTLHGLSNLAFDDLLQLFKETVPEAKLPSIFAQAKSTVSDLGLDYKNIPACPNDCMLYWKGYEHNDSCHICHTSRWKLMQEKQGRKLNKTFQKNSKGSGAKIVWHFPLKHRKRGPTMMHGVQLRKPNEREIILCNEFAQPNGPKTEEKDTVGIFSRFLGTIARNYDNAPLTYNSWHKVPEKEKDKMWEYVLNQYLLKRNARKAQKNMHVAGPKSFARIREEMMNENPNKDQPTSSQMFERTCKRTIGNVYCETYDDTTNKIEQMKNYQLPEDENALVDPFVAVIGKEYDGHCRLYGKGVTKKLLKKVNVGSTSYMVSRDLMESLKASAEAEKKQLVDMRKELKEEYEKDKAELEAIQQDIDNKMQKLMENMRTQALETLQR